MFFFLNIFCAHKNRWTDGMTDRWTGEQTKRLYKYFAPFLESAKKVFQPKT